MFTNSAEAKKNGWFSRRHQTREAHDAANAAREGRHAAKMERARAQAEATRINRLNRTSTKPIPDEVLKKMSEMAKPKKANDRTHDKPRKSKGKKLPKLETLEQVEVKLDAKGGKR